MNFNKEEDTASHSEPEKKKKKVTEKVVPLFIPKKGLWSSVEVR